VWRAAQGRSTFRGLHDGREPWC